jgi:hypothetical protein
MVGLGVWLLVTRRSIGIMAASRLSITPQRNLHNVFLFGIGYAVGSLSCTLPVFLVVVGSTLATQGVLSSFSQFIAYSLGMGTILVAVTVGAALFRSRNSSPLAPCCCALRASYERAVSARGRCLPDLLLGLLCRLLFLEPIPFGPALLLTGKVFQWRWRTEEQP